MSNNATLREYWPLAAAAGQPNWQGATPKPERNPSAPITCDVAIVGAGIMGLSCALTLARLGKDVVVLEADYPGAGASGRNGGLVVPSLPRLGPADVIRLLGPDYGSRMVTMVAQSAQEVFDLIRAHQLRCDAMQTGWINPAHANELVAGLQQRVAAWQQAGAQAQWIDAQRMADRIGSPHYHGALFDPTGGHLNPFAYTSELSRIASNAGARIYTSTIVERIERHGADHVLQTTAGRVRAGKVLQCTNAMQASTTSLDQNVATSVVPLTVFQLATQPLGDDVLRSILPARESLSDTRNNLFAIRHTADGRIVTGGMAPLTQWRAVPRLLRSLARRMERIFPQWKQVQFDYIWKGMAALTPDFLPRLMQVDPDWIAPIGCNGRGIAMSTALGNRLARYLVDGDAATLPLPLVPAAPIKGYSLAKYTPQLLLPLGIVQDAMRK